MAWASVLLYWILALLWFGHMHEALDNVDSLYNTTNLNAFIQHLYYKQEINME